MLDPFRAVDRADAATGNRSGIHVFHRGDTFSTLTCCDYSQDQGEHQKGIFLRE